MFNMSKYTIKGVPQDDVSFDLDTVCIPQKWLENPETVKTVSTFLGQDVESVVMRKLRNYWFESMVVLTTDTKSVESIDLIDRILRGAIPSFVKELMRDLVIRRMDTHCYIGFTTASRAVDYDVTAHLYGKMCKAEQKYVPCVTAEEIKEARIALKVVQTPTAERIKANLRPAVSSWEPGAGMTKVHSDLQYIFMSPFFGVIHEEDISFHIPLIEITDKRIKISSAQLFEKGTTRRATSGAKRENEAWKSTKDAGNSQDIPLQVYYDTFQTFCADPTTNWFLDMVYEVEDLGEDVYAIRNKINEDKMNEPYIADELKYTAYIGFENATPYLVATECEYQFVDLVEDRTDVSLQMKKIAKRFELSYRLRQ